MRKREDGGEDRVGRQSAGGKAPRDGYSSRSNERQTNSASNTYRDRETNQWPAAQNNRGDYEQNYWESEQRNAKASAWDRSGRDEQEAMYDREYRYEQYDRYDRYERGDRNNREDYYNRDNYDRDRRESREQPSGAKASSRANTGRVSGSKVTAHGASDQSGSGKNADRTGKGERRGNRNKSGRYRLLVVVAIFLLFYIPPTLNWFNNKNIATDILRNGTLLESINTDAIIIRSETLIYATADGVTIPAVNEGERISGNARVATVYNRASLELMEELKQKNRLILQNQHEKLIGTNYVVGEAESIEGDIYRLISRMVPDLNKNSLHSAAAQASEIDKLVLKKAEVYSNIPSDDAYVNQLKREKQSIETQLSAVSNEVYTEQAGHVSFRIDQFENQLTFDGFSSITVNDFERMHSELKARQLRMTEY